MFRAEGQKLILHWLIKDVKTILGEYQHKLLVMDLDDRSIRKKVLQAVKRVWKLEKLSIRKGSQKEFMIWLIRIIKIYGTLSEVGF